MGYESTLSSLRIFGCFCRISQSRVTLLLKNPSPVQFHSSCISPLGNIHRLLCQDASCPPVCLQHLPNQFLHSCFLSPDGPSLLRSCQACGPIIARPGSSAMWNLTLCTEGTPGPRWESVRGRETASVRVSQSTVCMSLKYRGLIVSATKLSSEKVI